MGLTAQPSLMSLTLTEDEFFKFLASPKTVTGMLKYNKKGGSYYEASVAVRCPDFPGINIRLISNYHSTRNPRKFSISLICNGERAFAVDVNSGTTHRNPITLEVIRGDHWHIYPHKTTAIEDGIERNHQQWMNDFLTQSNITIEGGYTAPAFEAENIQLDFLGENQ